MINPSLTAFNETPPHPPHPADAGALVRRVKGVRGGSVGAEGRAPKEPPQMSPRNRERPQTPSGSLENTVAQLPRTCVGRFGTRWSPDAERPAVNSAIKRTMCSGLLQAAVILTLVARVDVGLRRYTRAAHTRTAAHCLRPMRWRQSLSTLATKRHRDGAKRGLTGLFLAAQNHPLTLVLKAAS